MISCVYQILNLVTGDMYIGSSVNYKERWCRHRKDLRAGRHHSKYLQRSWIKYGEASFEFRVLEFCSSDLIREQENYWLDWFKPVYNTNKDSRSPLGRKLSAAHVAAITRYVRLNNVKPPESTWKLKQKKVDMLDKTTSQVLQSFDSISDACRFIGKDHTYVTTIANVCNGVKRKTAFGYKWQWSNQSAYDRTVDSTAG